VEALDPARLQAILDLLVQSGVEEFEGFGFHVRFTTAMFTPDKEVANQPIEIREERAEPTSMWEVPELWPGGKRPSFPGK
jgi:hypothetical protein